MDMEKKIIAIDPGKSGGIAVLDGRGEVIEVCKMMDTPKDILEFLDEFRDDSVCYLEKVGGIPGNGASSMFSFGRGFGHLEMALLALGIPTVTVMPQKWQKSYSVGSSSVTKSSAAEKREHKNKLKEKAQQLFPSLGKKVTLCTCDALLIAYYGLKNEKI